MDIQDSKTRFFEVFYLILKNMHVKREGLLYGFIDYFKVFIEKNKSKKDVNTYMPDLTSIINILCYIKKEHNKIPRYSHTVTVMLENATYDSGILLLFSKLLSPEDVDYKENIELFKTCLDSEYEWEELLEDYKDYYEKTI